MSTPIENKIEKTLKLIEKLSAKDFAKMDTALAKLNQTDQAINFDNMLRVLPSNVGVAIKNIQDIYNEVAKLADPGPQALVMTNALSKVAPNNSELVKQVVSAKIAVLQAILDSHDYSQLLHLSPLHEAISQKRYELTGIMAETERRTKKKDAELESFKQATNYEELRKPYNDIIQNKVRLPEEVEQRIKEQFGALNKKLIDLDKILSQKANAKFLKASKEEATLTYKILAEKDKIKATQSAPKIADKLRRVGMFFSPIARVKNLAKKLSLPSSKKKESSMTTPDNKGEPDNSQTTWKPGNFRK